jgi:hypothetical protein
MVCCSRCSRHYFQAEPDCPFCAAEGPTSTQGLRRLAAIGGAALLIAGCAPEPPVMVMYGPPPIPSPAPSVSATPAPTPPSSPQ